MKQWMIGLCGLVLVVAAGGADARECRTPGARDGYVDRRAREAAYAECARQRREDREQRRQERRDARKPIDQSANAPPPERMVQPLQSK